MSAVAQNGHAVSVDSTWRRQEGQGISDRIGIPHFAASSVSGEPSVGAPASLAESVPASGKGDTPYGTIADCDWHAAPSSAAPAATSAARARRAGSGPEQPV